MYNRKVGSCNVAAILRENLNIPKLWNISLPNNNFYSKSKFERIDDRAQNKYK